MIQALREHHKNQLEEKIKYRGLWEDHDFVFTTHTGNPINLTNLRNRSFKPLPKKAGLPEIRFHDLRHTCATPLLKQDASPKKVAGLLGHNTMTAPLDTYSHLLPDTRDDIVAAMDDALGS